jgi:hypothetical protein
MKNWVLLTRPAALLSTVLLWKNLLPLIFYQPWIGRHSLVGVPSLGATPLSQAGLSAVEGQHVGPREGGAADAGLRRASLSPQSKTLSRSRGRWSFV